MRDGSESIRAREVRVVFPGGTAGTMPVSAALRRAKELELDLVVVSPAAVPPVAKAIDYKFYPVRDEEEGESSG